MGAELTKEEKHDSCDHPPISTDDIVGKSLGQAKKYLLPSGMILRVVKQDGIEFYVTQDYRTDRVNVDVMKGIIVGIRGVY
jgi:hypothetical protein